MRTLAITVLVAAFVLGNLQPAAAGQWSRVFAATVVVVLMAAAGWFGYVFGRASAKTDQTYSQELGRDPDHKGLGPKEFAMDVRVEPADLLYDLTVGFNGSTADPAIHRGLTIVDLRLKLAEHAITLPDNAIRGRHSRNTDGLQLTWQPSTTDTTGDPR